MSEIGAKPSSLAIIPVQAYTRLRTSAMLCLGGTGSTEDK